MNRRLSIFLILTLCFLMLPGMNAQAATNEQLVKKAKEYVGVPYLYGGNSPSGFDCSGFLVYVFDQLGMDLPRTSADQYQQGTSVSKSNLQPGDLVFFKNTYKPGISHAGIYVGDNKFISSTSSSGVQIVSLSNTYWGPRYAGAKRLSTITYDGFVDLSKDHEAYDAIIALYNEDIISGYNNNQFKPENPVTRGQAAAIINRVLGLQATNLNSFKDVNASNIFAKDIAAIKSTGIISGYSDGTFRPNEYMTKAQMAVIVDRALGDDVKSASTTSLVYSDVHPGYWAYSAIMVLYSTDKTAVFDGPKFKASVRATRAEFSTAIYNLK